MSETLLCFILISDSHLSSDPDYGADTGIPSRKGAEALVRQINALPFVPDFVLHAGDVAYDPVPDAYQVARDIFGQIRCPVYYLAGNHDDPQALQHMLLGRETILTPFHYSFEINGVQIVCLDSNGPAEWPRGSLSDEQLNWLEATCANAADNRPLVVALHHNPLPVGVPWLDQHLGLTNGEALHQALLPGRRRLRGVFFGHVHQNLDIYRDGILYSSTVSSWVQYHGWPGQVPTLEDRGAEPGFTLVTVSADQTYIRRCRFAV